MKTAPAAAGAPGPRRAGWPAAVLLGAILLGTGGSVGATENLFKALQVERSSPPRRSHDFALETPDGKTLRLKDFRGSGVFLNFLGDVVPGMPERDAVPGAAPPGVQGPRPCDPRGGPPRVRRRGPTRAGTRGPCTFGRTLSADGAGGAS